MEKDFNELINEVTSEFYLIDTELEIQTEKLKGVQEKLGVNKQNLDKNLSVLNRLKESTKMDKIMKITVSIVLIFLILLTISKYATFKDLIVDLKKLKKLI
jgi:hypothetical protein